MASGADARSTLTHTDTGRARAAGASRSGPAGSDSFGKAISAIGQAICEPTGRKAVVTL